LTRVAYQASGIAKAPSTTEYILDWLEGSDSTQKLVVFAHHKDVLDYIETNISKKYKGRLGMIRIDGSVSPAERAMKVKKFQSNVTIRLALLSMTAAGVGLTLTAASNIVFAELHWTPGILAQAEDR
jgi:SWI/SNF-related matrix-associated actin-dependent regulator 1 of chromatin subfamily A